MPPLESRLVETKSENAPWWLPQPPLTPYMHNLFVTYSGLDDAEVLPHVATCRAKAWQIRPYPCVGMWAFLKSNIMWGQLENEYQQILHRIKSGASILDLGCALGQDLRCLASDGAPTENMYATDVQQEFWDLSYELFRDREKLEATFICSDIFHADSSLLKQLSGKIDIMISGDFLHLFDWDGQVEAASRMVRLGQPKAGTMIIGKQIGRRTGRPVPTKWGSKDVMYMHDESTFADLWKEVGIRTGTSWTVRTRMASFGEGGFWAPKEDFAWMAEDAIGLQFVVLRQAPVAAAL